MSCRTTNYPIEDRYIELICDQGATFYYLIAIQDEGGGAVDLTDYDARMQVRPTVGSEVVIVELLTTNDRISIDAPNGYVYLYISAEDTNLLDDGSYVYDLELILPNGQVWRVIEGDFIITPQVTR